MLTPQDIEKKVFVKAVFGGYEMATVDDFIEALSEDYGALYKENAILKSKIKVLVEKVEEYRSTEDVMRMTLLAAQKTSNEMMEEAKAKSEAALSELDNAVTAKRQEIDEAFKTELAKLSAAKTATAEFVAAVRAVMDKHSDFLDRLGELAPPAPKGTPEDIFPETGEFPEAPVAPAVSEAPPAEPAADYSLSVEKAIASAVASAIGVSATGAPSDMETTQRLDFITDAGDLPVDGGSANSRPKFDFENLQFGLNYKNDD